MRTIVAFWIIAALGLPWNAFGVYDFVMTNIRDQAYVARIPPETMDFIDGFPPWMTAAWALGVFAALAGSLLLLVCSRFCVHAFAASLVGLALSDAYQLRAGLPPAMRTFGSLATIAAIWAIAIGLLLYARWMRRIDILR